MTWEISEIISCERRNAYVPLSYLQRAAAAYIAEQWADGHALFNAIQSGCFDYDSEAEGFNEALEAAGSEGGIEPEELKIALKEWAEAQI